MSFNKFINRSFTLDAIQCLIFSVDFEENIISFKVPPAVLERGIKYGHASIDFRAITGNSKTQQGEPKPLPTTKVKTPPEEPAAPEGEIKPMCSRCWYHINNTVCSTCFSFSNFRAV